MPEPFRTTRLVEFHDTDMAGIMHFASFFVYMESAEHELLRSLGLSVHAPYEGEMLSFPRVAASCDFLSPARCEETLDVAISIPRIGAKSVTYEFRFTRDGQEIALGRMTSVCCRMLSSGSPRSTPIPSDIAAKLRTFAVE
jgi:4-hydroxybenzoyl-CoA thioesterase/acyl-CoA thioester hydrolase